MPVHPTMSVSLATASLRAAWRRELRRLLARPMEGGPLDAVREGALLAVYDGPTAQVIVDDATVSVLARLPDGAGPGAVRSVLTAAPAHPARDASLPPCHREPDPGSHAARGGGGGFTP